MMQAPRPASAAQPVWSWYIQRLRRMSGPELAHRGGEAIGDLVTALKLKAVGPSDRTTWRRAIEASLRAGVKLPDLDWDVARLHSDADDLLAGRFAYGGLVWNIDEADWNAAPETSASWGNAFSPWLAHSLKKQGADVRVTWEPNRLQTLIGLALLANMVDGGMREDALSLIRRRLSSWLGQNAYLSGVNYVSAMECAQRLLSVLFAIHIARPLIPREDTIWRDAANIIDTHSTVIAGRLSLYSSLGNHTVAESVALYLACLTLPLEKARAREQQALRALTQACERIFLPDGGIAEQSTAYLALVVDLLHLAALTGRRNGRDTGVFERLRDRSSAFLKAVAIGDELPPIGDSDSSHALSVYMKPSWRAAAQDNRPMRTFPDAGYTVFRGEEAIAIFDHGPLGMSPNYAHGHADALSVLLWVRGEPVLIDPGTCAYARAGGWRDYFRGTSAHNTLTVNDANQALSEGPFLWSSPPKVTLDEAQSRAGGSVVVARHDGYGAQGIIHQRGMLFRPHSIIVIDRAFGLEGADSAAAAVKLRWHMAGEVTREGDLFRHEGTGVTLAVSGMARQAALTQSHSPRGGWRSPRYGVLEAATTLEFSEPAGDLVVTRISLTPSGEACGDEAAAVADLSHRMFDYLKERGSAT